MAGKVSKSLYVCDECGAQAAKWSGVCAECGTWNSLTETVQRRGRGKVVGAAGAAMVPVRLGDVDVPHIDRIGTGSREFDRVLGGGLVPGSVILIGGEPGIGKSTLLLQCLAVLSTSRQCLYVTGEESLAQTALRSRRLDVAPVALSVLAENDLERVIGSITAGKPAVVVMDSIQTFYSPQLESAPGSVSQVRETGARLVRLAKESGIVMLVVGHVTKEGQIAGPRILEHMVDTVLYFEGDDSSRHRIVRAVKNRFGAVNEIGVFAMTDKGLREVGNPSAMFLQRAPSGAAGSVVLATQQGTRPLLVEVQALVDPASGPTPKRIALGLESTRLAMLLAVMHRHGGLDLSNQDVFVNIVGGIRVPETAADVAVAIAVASSFLNRIVDPKLAAFGEVGLTGEIRPVPRGQDRLQEIAKLGFTRALIPVANKPRQELASVRIDTAPSVSDCLRMFTALPR